MTVLRHNHPTWNWFDVKAALRQTGSNWATGYNVNAYGFGQVNLAAANGYTDSQLLLQPPEVKARINSLQRIEFELYPFRQTRRVKDVLFQFPSAPTFQGNELTLAVIQALGGSKIMDYAGVEALLLQPFTDAVTDAYFVWFSADHIDDTAAKFSRIDSYSIFGPFSQVAGPVTIASPDQGTYYQPQTVELTCNDGTAAGCANTFYTTDGTNPTGNSSLYASPLTISFPTTLRFFSQDKHGNSEPVTTKIYAIVAPPVESVPALGPLGLLAAALMLAGFCLFGRQNQRR